MPEIYLGTSGWAYPSWKPAFYPAKTPAKKMLDYYSTQLNAVEVNYTFRAFPSVKTQENWAASTPANFRFALKANQRITHYQRLKNTGEILTAFLSSIETLQNLGRLGPILFQLPPNLKADVGLLDGFLAQVPKLRTAWEFRDASWFDEATFTVLRRHNAALCIAESEDLTTPEVVTADFCYFRFRKPPYDDRVKSIAERIQSLAKTVDVFAFFKHEESPEGALSAVAVRRTVDQ